MRGKETGQALLLILVLLAIAPIMVVQLLGLTGTTLKSTDTVSRQTTQIYAVDGATEYVIWQLLHKDWTSSFTEDGQTGYLSIENCGTTVNITVVMRAVPGAGGITLASDDVIQPTKTVEPSSRPDKSLYQYTYTIDLEQLSSNTTQGLDAIYDVPPGDMNDYIAGTSEVSMDGGTTWQSVPDPFEDWAKGYLQWPADYDKDTGTGAFSLDPLDTDHYFHGMRDFESREVKKLRFTLEGNLDNNTVHCNWVVLKPWNTVSGPQAPIDVGSPADPGVCASDDVINIVKSSDPEIIPVGVETQIRYDIDLANNYTQTRFIEKIIDYLPPEFEYVGPTENLTSFDPQGANSTVTINGIDRVRLEWGTAEFGGGDVSIASGETVRLTFYAMATKDVSGSYYNEVFVILKTSGISAAFEEIGVTPEEYGQNYSWNQGGVTVPTYDARSDSGDVMLDANLSAVLGGMSINSYQFR